MGSTCNEFLASVGAHKSKASSGYYLKTHLDYFSKLSSSIDRIVTVMRPGAKAILVVQDSYYKDVHNDLPTIVSEMAELSGLVVRVKRLRPSTLRQAIEMTHAVTDSSV
jgi:hypothetical protein